MKSRKCSKIKNRKSFKKNRKSFKKNRKSFKKNNSRSFRKKTVKRTMRAGSLDLELEDCKFTGRVPTREEDIPDSEVTVDFNLPNGNCFPLSYSRLSPTTDAAAAAGVTERAHPQPFSIIHNWDVTRGTQSCSKKRVALTKYNEDVKTYVLDSISALQAKVEERGWFQSSPNIWFLCVEEYALCFYIPKKMLEIFKESYIPRWGTVDAVSGLPEYLQKAEEARGDFQEAVVGFKAAHVAKEWEREYQKITALWDSLKVTIEKYSRDGFQYAILRQHYGFYQDGDGDDNNDTAILLRRGGYRNAWSWKKYLQHGWFVCF